MCDREMLSADKMGCKGYLFSLELAPESFFVSFQSPLGNRSTYVRTHSLETDNIDTPTCKYLHVHDCFRSLI